jgi:hypothetical protein
MTPISAYARFYLYGLQGLSTEIFYTAIWDFFALTSWKFIGVSSIWAFFIYAISHMFIEYVKPKLKAKHIPMFLRAFIYLLWTYFWEFSTGYTLSIFNACPWNYEGSLNWHFMGLITLEYAPLWYIGSIFAEQVTIPLVNKLHWIDTPRLERSTLVKND